MAETHDRRTVMDKFKEAFQQVEQECKQQEKKIEDLTLLLKTFMEDVAKYLQPTLVEEILAETQRKLQVNWDKADEISEEVPGFSRGDFATRSNGSYDFSKAFREFLTDSSLWIVDPQGSVHDGTITNQWQKWVKETYGLEAKQAKKIANISGKVYQSLNLKRDDVEHRVYGIRRLDQPKSASSTPPTVTTAVH